MKRRLSKRMSLSDRQREVLSFVFIAIVVFLSRLPFIGTGFGRDPDAWRFVNAAHLITTTHEYHASRLPGYPIPEFVYSFLLMISSPWLVVIAALSAIGAASFALIARIYGSKDYLFAGMALAFTPVVYINSTNSMDYIWALTFVLGALYFVLRQNFLTAGILVGISVGCRITSVAMLLPFTLMLLERQPAHGSRMKNIWTLWLAALITSGVLYTPVLVKYGLDMFTFVNTDNKISRIAELAGSGVWGTIGVGTIVVAICASIFFSVSKSRIEPSVPASVPNRHLFAWLAVIVIYSAIFLWLPAEAGYLTIIVPFVILVLARFLERWIFIMVCVLLAASSFVEINRSGILPGPILQNRYIRNIYLMDSIIALRIADKLDSDKLVIVAGWMAPQLQALRTLEGIPDDRKMVVFAYKIDVPILKEHLASGYEVYIVPLRVSPGRQDVISDLLDNGAKMLPNMAP